MLRESDIWQRTLVGALAGLGASYIMGKFMSHAPEILEEKMPDTKQPLRFSREEDEEQEEQSQPATVKAADQAAQLIAHREIPEDKKPLAGQFAHYAFGTCLGALYGALSPYIHKHVGMWGGLGYGFAVWMLADEIVVPRLGLSKPALETPVSSHLAALGGHLIYGVTVESAVRAAVR